MTPRASEPAALRTRAEIEASLDRLDLALFRKLRRIRNRFGLNASVPLVMKAEQEHRDAMQPHLEALDRLKLLEEGEAEGEA